MLLELVAVLALVGWGVLAGTRVERRLVPMLIRQARGRPLRGALMAAGAQLGGLAAFGIAILVASLPASRAVTSAPLSMPRLAPEDLRPS